MSRVVAAMPNLLLINFQPFYQKKRKKNIVTKINNKGRYYQPRKLGGNFGKVTSNNQLTLSLSEVPFITQNITGNL